jgi:hypothetical protein
MGDEGLLLFPGEREKDESNANTNELSVRENIAAVVSATDLPLVLGIQGSLTLRAITSKTV